MKILGEVIAPNFTGFWDGRDASEWLVFSETNGLYVNGYGAIDGQGQAWWDQSCRYHPQLVHLFIYFKLISLYNYVIFLFSIINSS